MTDTDRRTAAARNAVPELLAEVERLTVERDKARADWAQRAGIEDLARLLVEGDEYGYPVADGSYEDLVGRLRAALSEPQP